MTGASGYVGSRITAMAIEQGYTVVGLSRSESDDAKLCELGAQPVRGDLTSLHVLRTQSAAADAVIHLADAFGGSYYTMPRDKVVATDADAVAAMAAPLKGTDKPFIATSGTLATAPDPDGGETTEESPEDPHPVVDRAEVERNTLGWAARGVRVCIIRLAPFVYGHGGSGIRFLMTMQAPAGAIAYVKDDIEETKPRYTSSVHVDDAARLYLLALDKAKAGQVFNGVSSTTVSLRQISEAMAEVLDLPLENVTPKQISARSGDFVAQFLSTTTRASGAKAMRELDWQPREVSILEDIRNGSYVPVAEYIRDTIAL